MQPLDHGPRQPSRPPFSAAIVGEGSSTPQSWDPNNNPSNPNSFHAWNSRASQQPLITMYINAVYYPNWRVYRNQPPSSLNFAMISHVFYAFAQSVPALLLMITNGMLTWMQCFGRRYDNCKTVNWDLELFSDI
jgi:hypothetical protein